MNRGKLQLTITVLPDCGTSEFVGLTGTMSIPIDDEKYSSEFQYALDHIP